ncbi:MAG TPA: 4'-phosphopantetheinyl transferase superfamily protein [Hanamia sp.]
MKSLGNDIVALRSVDKQRTSQFRFYSKILSSSEQEFYHQPQFAEMPFENYVWLLWSVKESVYKYLKRAFPNLVFSPTKIIIQKIEIPPVLLMTKSEDIQWENTGNDKELYSGKVIYESKIFYFQSKINKDWIATVVNEDEKFYNVFWGIQSIDNAGYYYQSKAARTLLLKKINSFFPGDLHVDKTPVGYPVILKGIQNMHIPVSLAHHGHFVAYSFILNPAHKKI